MHSAFHIARGNKELAHLGIHFTNGQVRIGVFNSQLFVLFDRLGKKVQGFLIVLHLQSVVGRRHPQEAVDDSHADVEEGEVGGNFNGPLIGGYGRLVSA